jgi:hypothetical protein
MVTRNSLNRYLHQEIVCGLRKRGGAPEALQAGGLKKFADNPISKILGREL